MNCVRRSLSAWLVLAALAAPVPAAAEGPAPANPKAAAELAERGRALFEAGHADQAIPLAEEAYRLDPQPILLYNVARGYEQLGDVPRAIQAYRRYVEAAPDRPERPAIEQRMATLQRLLDERGALAKDYERRVAELGARHRAVLVKALTAPRGPLLPIGAAGAALGAAGIGTGAILWAVAAGHHADAVAPSTMGVTATQDENLAKSFAQAGNVAFGVGAAVGVAGAVMAIVGSREKRLDMGDKSFGLVPSFGPGWLALKGRF